MSDELTTQPMVEILLEEVRRVSSALLDLRGAVAAISEKQDELVARQDALVAKQDALAAKQEALAATQEALAVSQAALAANQAALKANQDALTAKVDDLTARQERFEVRVAELSNEVRDGFFHYNRGLEVLNNRLFTFEKTVKRVEERLHDEILVRTH